MIKTAQVNHFSRLRGFTLIEIIVAMAVLAITALAINTALVRHVDAAIRLEKKLIANWVASNAIAF